ncbi:MAG: NADH:flavin oxidoreductase/NADH oxidase [Gammaproteobacteria bacterium]|nr:NADH:flavin oxidoreductase/NADH oxidase [Gammaproteobacteria bacterium]MDH3535447.1 NADH:flavin oxidoreductase/NADH oxidase [Gammaproteobacteria bacterium]
MTNPVKLFEPLTIRDTRLPNRIVVSPLCQYSAVDGLAQPWHFAHLSTFARGKAGLVFTEATAVEERGRITPVCLGIWNDAQADALRPITAFIESMGCVPGMQLAHAGRKASTRPPFAARGPIPLNEADRETDGAPWQTVAPSALPVADGWHVPAELDAAGLQQVRQAFVDAARRAVDAGFRVLELHMAHGYLLHSFLSPLGNQRGDAYGGDLESRMRFPLEVASAVREAIPDGMPLFSRISAIDGREGGWTIEDSVVFSDKMLQAGVDVVDCSSGGIGGAPRFRSDDSGKPLTADSARSPGFQVPFSRRLREQTGIKSMAVGVIIDPHQAEEILQSGGADLVALGRELMYDPFWPLHAAQALGVDPDYRMWPTQYAWAIDRRAQIKTLNQGG